MPLSFQPLWFGLWLVTICAHNKYISPSRIFGSSLCEKDLLEKWGSSCINIWGRDWRFSKQGKCEKFCGRWQFDFAPVFHAVHYFSLPPYALGPLPRRYICSSEKNGIFRPEPTIDGVSQCFVMEAWYSQCRGNKLCPRGDCGGWTGDERGCNSTVESDEQCNGQVPKARSRELEALASEWNPAFRSTNFYFWVFLSIAIPDSSYLWILYIEIRNILTFINHALDFDILVWPVQATFQKKLSE